jgi:serine/threonine-protein kinase
MASKSVASCPSCGSALDVEGACIACGATFLADDAILSVEPAPRPLRKDDSLVGREIIGQYVIRERIGDGGMGAVYRAEQRTVGRDAAIKVLHPRLSTPALAERFQQEARAASQLNHPHIVTIYNYGTMDDGTPFLAMEFLDGVSLQQVIARTGAMSPERVVHIASQIADSLDEAHRSGIVHRDLKPHNVMLVERSQQPDFVKVLDFGMAKVQGVEMTADGLLCGTPRYMSPEQLRGGTIDGRSDLYSLGIVLFEMLAGRTPFQADDVLGFVHQHLNAPPPSLSEVAPSKKIPPALEDLVRRLLAKSPSQRPKRAAHVVDELARVLDPDRAPRAPRRSEAALAPVAARGLALPAGRVRAVARRSWAWLVAAARELFERLRRGGRALVTRGKARLEKLLGRGPLERLGLRRSPVARARARVRRAWQDSRAWASSLSRQLRKRRRRERPGTTRSRR